MYKRSTTWSGQITQIVGSCIAMKNNDIVSESFAIDNCGFISHREHNAIPDNKYSARVELHKYIYCRKAFKEYHDIQIAIDYGLKLKISSFRLNCFGYRVGHVYKVYL